MAQNLIPNLQKTQKQYVMDALYCTDYSETSGEVEITDSLTDKGKLQYVASALKTEAFYDNNIRKFGGNRPRIIADHFQGLPSYINIPYENYKIIEQGKEWGYDLSTESKENNYCENWWINIGSKLTQLMDKHGVEIKKYSLDELDFNDGMKKVDESKETIEEYLDENLAQKVDIVEHENGTYLYFNPELKNEVNKSLEPLLSYKSLDSLVQDLDNKPEFSGLNNQDLEYLGFKKARELKLGNEYHIESSLEMLEKLKSLGYTKTWGYEGLTNAYATFKVDNKDHEDYGKTYISVRENDSVDSTFTYNLDSLVDVVYSKIEKNAERLNYKIIDEKLLEKGIKETLDKINKKDFNPENLNHSIKFPVSEKIHDAITGTEVRNTLLEADIRHSIVKSAENFLSEKGVKILSINERLERAYDLSDAEKEINDNKKSIKKDR